MHANDTLILSHTAHSLTHYSASIGEIANAQRFAHLIESKQLAKVSLCDIHETLADLYTPLSELNYALALAGEPLIENIALPVAQKIAAALTSHPYKRLFLLTFAPALAAFFALGVHKKIPTYCKCQVFHEEEKVLRHLYEPAAFLITESLLASKKALACGLSAKKILYLPNQYSPQIEKIQKKPHYLTDLEQQNQKKLNLKSTTLLLGVISRCECRKNIEYALEVANRLFEEGHDIRLILKGNFDVITPYSAYTEFLSTLLAQMQNTPWFFWDKELTPPSDTLAIYPYFDLFLHLSGAEGGSNTVVEFLATGKPTVVLEATTNPSLFKHAALFVKPSTLLTQMSLPFAIPDKEDLYTKVRALITDKKFRLALGQKAKLIAQDRFAPAITEHRISLMLNNKQTDHLYAQDRELYDY